MSQTTPGQPADPDFFHRVDAHLALANDKVGKAPTPLIAASHSYSAARFNTWLLANRLGSPERMKAQREDAIAQLTAHYREQLTQNYDDFVANYYTYIQPGVSTGPVL